MFSVRDSFIVESDISFIVSDEEVSGDDLRRRRRKKSYDRLKKEALEIDKKPYHPSPPMDEDVLKSPRRKKKGTK